MKGKLAIVRGGIDDQLRQIPLFASLDAADRRAVVAAAEVVEITSGEAITREGTTTDCLFVMLSGEATVFVASEDGSGLVELGSVRAGETLGELGALLGEPRTASVIADRHCRLLRIDAAALEALFASNPKFGIAFSRELAQRLKQALAIKNELQIEDLPSKVVLEAPDITRMRQYMVTYYATALKHVLKQHRLVLERRFPSYETTFTLTLDEQARWLALFDTGKVETPFTYHTTVGTMVLMRVVGDVGVNFKNLMHLKCEMSIAPGHVMEAGRSYRLASQIEDLMALRDDRVALVCGSRVYDDHGHQVRSYRDFFIILNLETEYVEALRATKNYGRLDPAEFQALAARPPQLTQSDNVDHVAIDVPEGMGLSYGKVSGDLNLVHTTHLGAKVFGHPRPFVQGLCTANYVLRNLTNAFGAPESLSITFAKRVFIGQRIDLHYTGSEFEICDSSGSLLAFGNYSLPR